MPTTTPQQPPQHQLTLGSVIDAAAQLSRQDQEQLLKLLQIILASPKPRRRRPAVAAGTGDSAAAQPSVQPQPN